MCVLRIISTEIIALRVSWTELRTKEGKERSLCYKGKGFENKGPHIEREGGKGVFC